MLDGRFRAIWFGRLLFYEMVFVMIVHKFQGSEFDWMVLVLSERWSFVLLCELFYMVLSWVISMVVIWGSCEILADVVSQRVRWVSGLIYWLLVFVLTE